MSRADAAIESVLARWIAAPGRVSTALPALVGGAVSVRSLGTRAAALDPFAALAEVHVATHTITVAASGTFARELAQRMLGGPLELAAPRPLTGAEHALFALAVAAALEDARAPGEVWPVLDVAAARAAFAARAVTFALAFDIVGRGTLEVSVAIPPALLLALPPARAWPTWQLPFPVVVGECTLARTSLAALRIRDVIVLERRLALVIGPGWIALHAPPGAVEATVANGYVRRDMALPDDAHLELTVQLGTTQLSLRQLAELAPGSVVPLGRPLAGPFEVRAQGRLVGQGELVDVDGELGVRIVSLTE